MDNVITGRDDAVQSARQLGADRRISMWQKESSANLIVLQAPPIPKLDHPVPWLPPSKYALAEEEAAAVQVKNEAAAVEPQFREKDEAIKNGS